MIGRSFFILGFLLSATAALADAVTPPVRLSLNPETLRKQVLEGNLSLMTGLNQLHIAKERVNVARGNLFPSLNLGMLANAANAPTFILGSVDFLLPFLVPSNWFNLRQSQRLLEAEKVSYKALQLNTYASAQALYYTILSDQQVKLIQEAEARDLQQIEQILQLQSDTLGIVSPEDLSHARAQSGMAQLRASQMNELLKKEIASLRSALGLPLSSTILLEDTVVAPSESEDRPLEQVVETALSVSPENQQIDQLIVAAESEQWSKTFGFITGASAGSQAAMGKDGQLHNASLENLTGRGSMNFGFAYFPTVEIASRNVEALRLRKTGLRLEQTALLESALSAAREAQDQLDLAISAETELKAVYDAKALKYNLGLGSLTAVLQARTHLTQASVAKVKATLDLNLIRTTLHRALLTDQFGEIQGCQAPVSATSDDEGFFGALKRWLSGGEQEISLEQACRG